MNLNFWFDRFRTFGLDTRKILILILLSLVSTISEVIGIGIFLPIFQFIQLDGDLNALIEYSGLWQYIIDGFYFLNIETSLLALLLTSFSFFVFRQLLVYLRLVYTTAVAQNLVQKQRNQLFDKYMEADTTYHDSVPVGNLVNIIVTETNSAIVGVMGPLELVVYMIMLIGYLITMAILSWQMTLLSVVAIIIAGAIPKVWIKQSKVTGRNLVNANTLMTEFLVGRLRSPRLVRLAGTENAEKKEFYRLTLAQRKHRIFSSILQSKTDVSMEPVIIGSSLVLLYFSYTVFQLQMEVIGMYLVIAMRLMPVAKSITLKIQSIQSVIGPIEILERRTQQMKNSMERDIGTVHLKKVSKSISIHNISYRYPMTEEHALKNISIKFKTGSINAIVGPSGSGKSTLIDLFPRLRLPSAGIIKIDGVNIAEYTLKSLRQLISYSPQSPQIFDGTIKNHILYGKSDATDKELQDAVQLAGAEEFINKLPKGLNTIIGDDAVKLSGGQRQRLDLARALIKKTKILILDEPNSNLDIESEKIFTKVLKKIQKETNTTIIIVAHRLQSIADADQIIVLNQGRIDATGAHNELLKQRGWYAKAWKMQIQH
jgi:ABC-type multidrug transport system fused ATPase/permease subunit